MRIKKTAASKAYVDNRITRHKSLTAKLLTLLHKLRKTATFKYKDAIISSTPSEKMAAT